MSVSLDMDEIALAVCSYLVTLKKVSDERPLQVHWTFDLSPQLIGRIRSGEMPTRIGTEDVGMTTTVSNLNRFEDLLEETIFVVRSKGSPFK